MRREQFYAKYQHLGVDQRELERKYQAYLREQEEMMFLYEAAQKSSSSSAPGLAGGGGSGGGANFAAVFGEFEGSGYYSYPQSVTADADGYLYTLSVAEYEGPVTNALRKLSPTGEIIWQYLIQSGAPEAYIGPSRIRFSPDGYLYTIFGSGIAKFDPETGDLIWSWLLDTNSINTRMNSLAFLSDSTPVTLSNYGGLYPANLLCTWDKETGDKLSEKEFSLAGMTEQYASADIVIDADDNIILPLAYYDGETYGTEIVKWSLEADNEVWNFNINAIDYEDEDQDVTGMGIDAQGNIYVNGYGRGLTKFSPLGDLIWARVVGTYMPGLAVSPDGDCYMYGDPGVDLQVTKISTDGDLQWSYRIDAGLLDNAGWYNEANSMAQYINGSIYLMASYAPTATEQELILKVGDQQILGEYGPFTFTDYTETVLTVNPTDAGYPLNWDDTSYLVQAPILLDISPEGISPQTIQLTNLP